MRSSERILSGKRVRPSLSPGAGCVPPALFSLWRKRKSREGRLQAGQPRGSQARTHKGGAFGERFQLGKGGAARKVFHAAIGRPDEAFGRHERKGGADPCCYRLSALRLRVAEVEDAEDDRLPGEVIEHTEIEMRLRGLDRDLSGDRVRKLRQEGIAARLLLHRMRIAE